jgi:hypothetical protein
LGEERRLLATRQTRSAIRSIAALLQSADADLIDCEPEPTAVGRSALAVVRPPMKHTADRTASRAARLSWPRTSCVWWAPFAWRRVLLDVSAGRILGKRNACAACPHSVTGEEYKYN